MLDVKTVCGQIWINENIKNTSITMVAAVLRPLSALCMITMLFGSAHRNPNISSAREYIPCSDGARFASAKIKLPSTVRTGGGRRGHDLGPKLYTLTFPGAYLLSIYIFTSSMLFVLYADSNPSDGHGITRILDVIALISRSVLAIDC